MRVIQSCFITYSSRNSISNMTTVTADKSYSEIFGTRMEHSLSEESMTALNGGSTCTALQSLKT
ncbi:Uncharacterised protein [Enterobacter cloacae]|uniref:Uncharacterized protein n=1 Tax=Enterobacter cloacae TaxID=550 RepID=A0A0M7GL28_ENTCL|nr:hypothetical protein DR74_4914 [Enterobacter cloacae]CUI96412.1 Uncharacterised protein [Enterobacter cloacae]STQ10409.1 Uncharacterised protein [Enterobacter cloacae]